MTTPAPSRLKRILLPLSLGLNVLVLGVVAGALLHGPDGRPPRAVDLSLGPLTRALEQSDRQAISAQIRKDIRRGALAADSRAGRSGDLRALLEAIRAEPFDAGAISAHLAAQRVRVQTWGDAAERALLARLTAMTPAQRAAFADRLEREFRDRERMGDRDRGDRRQDRRGDRHRDR